MLKKYNIAFIPKNNQNLFVDYAQALTQTIPADRYLLGKQSLPHVSLCHFELEDSQIETLWKRVSDLNLPNLVLSFQSQRCKSYRNHPKWGGVCWISLMPDKLAQLHSLHWQLTTIIQKPLNAAFFDYDPHLTLLNSQSESESESINKNAVLNPSFIDEFIVALGLIDEVGQITEILS